MAGTEDLKSYRGNCHCGAFVFELKMPEIKVANECNCSLCKKKGYLFVFPGDDMTVVKGDGSLKEYTFNEGNTKHRFCPTCGIPVMAYNAHFPPGKNTAINARTIQDLDISRLEIKAFNGKDYGTPYTPPEYAGPEPAADVEGGKLYTGSCHCGAVTACIRTKPLDHTYPDRIRECNCSICQRAAYIWIYPKKDQVVIQGRENLAYYVITDANWHKGFCKTCGVQIMNEQDPLAPQHVDAGGEASGEGEFDWLAINIRVLDNFDLDAIKDKMEMFDGWNLWKPLYVNP